VKVLTGTQMKELDAQAMEAFGIPSLILMENAGRSIAEEIADRLLDLRGRRVTVVCGKGNNGGDGLVVARHLLQRGAQVESFVLGSPDALSPETSTQAKILESSGATLTYLTRDAELPALDAALAWAELIVDALLGIGVRGPLRGLYKRAIEWINAAQGFTVSVDLPSGLDADSGHVNGVCVEADVTVTLELLKLGLLLYPGRRYVGELLVGAIGYPPQLKAAFDSGLEQIERDWVAARLPRRRPDSHKGDYGHVLILAGSRGLSGAAILAGEAVLRSGAGLAYLGYPASLSPVIEARLVEAVKRPLPEADGVFSVAASKPALALIESDDIDVVALGPGISRRPSAKRFVERLLPAIDRPLVIDADGLIGLVGANGRSPLSARRAPTVLTPHPGEFARLTGRSVNEIEADRVGSARGFAKEYGVTLVLKGVPTVTALPSGKVLINSTGNSGLATGGSGDVLTGLIAGLIAQGMDPEEAAPAGVYLHGRAADRLKARLGERGMIAGDLLRALPRALKEFE
jgi:NAD(P)H-hydrate epimerase